LSSPKCSTRLADFPHQLGCVLLGDRDLCRLSLRQMIVNPLSLTRIDSIMFRD
jgi:hypothetical protein